MMDWRKFAKKLILASQKISAQETELLRRAILEDGVVDREEIEFLTELKHGGIARAGEFTWHRAAVETIAVYRKSLQK